MPMAVSFPQSPCPCLLTRKQKGNVPGHDTLPLVNKPCLLVLVHPDKYKSKTKALCGLNKCGEFAGTDMKGLLSRCMDSIIGSALPYVETGDAQEKELATTITQGGILKQFISGNAGMLEQLKSCESVAGPAIALCKTLKDYEYAGHIQCSGCLAVTRH